MLNFIYIEWNGTVESLIGLAICYIQYIPDSTVRLRAIVDNGTYYGLLLARGWLTLKEKLNKGK